MNNDMLVKFNNALGKGKLIFVGCCNNYGFTRIVIADDKYSAEQLFLNALKAKHEINVEDYMAQAGEPWFVEEVGETVSGSTGVTG